MGSDNDVVCGSDSDVLTMPYFSADLVKDWIAHVETFRACGAISHKIKLCI